MIFTFALLGLAMTCSKADRVYKPSRGCRIKEDIDSTDDLDFPKGRLASRNIYVSDDNFNISRNFAFYVPSTVNKKAPVPLMFYFHGQVYNPMTCTNINNITLLLVWKCT
jgi:hypothetical protein